MAENPLPQLQCPPPLSTRGDHRAAINDLPVEILVEILLTASDPLERWDLDRPRLPHHVHAQVCNRWANTIKDTPELWTRIAGCMPTSTWRTCLERSHDYPLVVTFIPRGEDNNPTLFWQALTENIHRWEDAILCCPASFNMTSMERVPAPMLRALIISTLSTCLLDPFQGSTPKLRHLKLEGITLKNWSSHLLHGLHSLTLRGMDVVKAGPSSQQVIDALHACPRLELLHLSRIPLRQTQEPSGQQVFLSELKEMTLELIPGNAMEALLAAVDAPRCQEWHLCPNDIPSSLLLAAAAHVTRAFPAERLSSSSASEARTYINVYGALLIISCDNGPSFECNLVRGEESQALDEQILACASKIHNDSLPTAVDLGLHGPFEPSTPIRWLMAFPAVRHLQLAYDSRPTFLCEALKILSEPFKDGSLGHKWHCPNLSDLSIWVSEAIPEPEIGPALLRLVRARAEAAQDIDGPAKLERLTVQGKKPVDDASFRALQELLGDKEVVSMCIY